MCSLEQATSVFKVDIIVSSMSLQQPTPGDHGSSKSQRKTRFTIDSILDKSPPARLVTDDEKSVPSDDELAPAADRGECGGALALCNATERQQPDERRNQTTIDCVDEELERIDDGSAADVEGGQRTAQCSSLLAQTASAFHRRHQRHVAQLRSFSELFFAQYQQYRRHLRNHFDHHSAQQPNTFNVLPAPLPAPPARSLSALDFHRRPPDVVRSTLNAMQRNFHDHRCELPTPTSTSAQPRNSTPTVGWCAVDQQSLPPLQLGRFVDGSTANHATSPQTSIAPVSDIKTHDEYSAVDYSNDRSRTKRTSSNNNGIRLLLLTHTRIKNKIRATNFVTLSDERTDLYIIEAKYFPCY